jgi:hypothetical protein
MTRLPKLYILGATLFAFCAAAMGDPAYTGQVSVGSASVNPGGHTVVPVYLHNNNAPLMALTIPLKYNSAAVRVDSISFGGTLLKPNMMPLIRIVNDSQKVQFTYSPISGLPMITEADGLLASIFFSADVGAPVETVKVDSVNRLEYAGPPQLWTRLELADTSGFTYFLPAFSSGTIAIQDPMAADDDQGALPGILALRQNFPNPFNPSTTISFSVPERGQVTLNVYNILGQQIATLVDGMTNPGEYEITWNGETMASGVYFYRLVYQDEVLTKKMTLLK